MATDFFTYAWHYFVVRGIWHITSRSPYSIVPVVVIVGLIVLYRRTRR